MTPKPPAPQSPHDPHRKAVLNLYAAFAVSLILSLMPHGIIALLALLFMIGVLITAYIVRARAETDTLAENHATYIIRTIWIGSLLAAITTTIGGIIMLTDIDYGPFAPCADQLAAQGMDFAANATYAQVWELASPCFDPFINANLNILIIAGSITILPILTYFAVRFVRGLSRAIKGYRLAQPRAWF